LRLKSTAQVAVTLTDVNDNAPVASAPLHVAIAEDTPLGSEVFAASATDADKAGGKNAAVELFFLGSTRKLDVFAMNASGHVVLTAPLDFELRSSYLLQGRARDGGKPTLLSDVFDVAFEVGQPSAAPRGDN